jgi:hypothetical protein
MYSQLPAGPQPRRNQVRVGVPGEQQDLKRQHASVPDSGSAAKPRQNVLSDDQLYLEEQEGAESDRQANQKGVGAVTESSV